MRVSLPLVSRSSSVSNPMSCAIMLAVSKSISSLIVARILFFMSSMMTVDTGVPKISAKRLTLTDDGILTIFFGSSVVTDASIEFLGKL